MITNNFRDIYSTRLIINGLKGHIDVVEVSKKKRSKGKARGLLN
ncbi:MAG: hypothetical protein QW607_10630 [Desulfurococcaceae archaeon]